MTGAGTVDATSVRGKILCGYQGWFRCPGDVAGMGWIHWSRDPRRIAPELLSFEMWPDLSEYSVAERYPAPGFTYPDGRQAELFSSDSACDRAPAFRVDARLRDRRGLAPAFPRGSARRTATQTGILRGCACSTMSAAAARQTERIWAISYDIAGYAGRTDLRCPDRRLEEAGR